MPGVLSQPGILATHPGAFASGEMAPPPPYAAPTIGPEWGSKQQQFGTRGTPPPQHTPQFQNAAMQGLRSMPPQLPGNGMHGSRHSTDGWQGMQQMPIRGGPDMQTIRSPSSRQSPMLPIGQQNQMLPHGRHNHDIVRQAPSPQSQSLSDGSMSVPRMNNMQSPLNSMQSQLMQVIALPVGAPPPEGAVPIGPMPSGAVQDNSSPQVLQVIAVPEGEAPPEGAIPVEQFPVASTMDPAMSAPATNGPWQAPSKPEPWQTPSKHEPWQNSSKSEPWQTPPKHDAWHSISNNEPWQDGWKSEIWPSPTKSEPWLEAAASESPKASPPSRRFRITDPRTGREVRSPEEEAATPSRRLRIVNPRTGEEVTN